jgi:hypothetical protein
MDWNDEFKIEIEGPQGELIKEEEDEVEWC